MNFSVRSARASTSATWARSASWVLRKASKAAGVGKRASNGSEPCVHLRRLHRVGVQLVRLGGGGPLGDGQVQRVLQRGGIEGRGGGVDAPPIDEHHPGLEVELARS